MSHAAPPMTHHPGPDALPYRVRSLWQRLRPILLAAGAFSFFINVLLLAPSLYMMVVFDRVMPAKSLPTLTLLTLGVGAALVVNLLLEILRSRVLIAIGAALDHHLGPQVIDALLTRSVDPRHEAAGAGLRDVVTLRNLLAGPGVFAIFDAPWLPLYLIVIAAISPMMGALALIGAISLGIVGWLTDRMTRPATDAAQVGLSRSTRFVDAAVRQAEIVHALGMAPVVKSRWLALNDLAVADHVHGSRIAANMAALSRLARLFVQTGMLGAGAWLMIEQTASPGVMLAATFVMGRAMLPVEQIVSSWALFSESLVAWQKLRQLLSEQPAKPTSMSLPAPTGKLKAEQLVLVLPGSTKPLLRAVSFEIAAGEAVGLVGPSASGKSTLARVLMGLWQPNAGTVRLDGADIQQWPREALARYVGYLPQDVSLFAGTVATNIARLGVPDPQAVVRAAQRAGAHEMILRLPKGYDTDIGDGGHVLSGGQRQRVGLARALYGDPRLVILDEPNANLDGEGEDALLKAFATLKQDRVTVVVIAHKPALFAGFDRLIVLRDGVVESNGPASAIAGKYGASTAAQAQPQPAATTQLALPPGLAPGSAAAQALQSMTPEQRAAVMQRVQQAQAQMSAAQRMGTPSAASYPASARAAVGVGDPGVVVLSQRHEPPLTIQPGLHAPNTLQVPA